MLLKTLCALSLLLAGRAGWAQQQFIPPPPVSAGSGLITYTAVVPTPGVTQANLLARAKVWANRVGVPAKPPLTVSEMGTDIVVVAGSQLLNPSFEVNPSRLYFLAQVALREGRYQYRFEEFTLETPSTNSFDTAEKFFVGPTAVPAKATSNAYPARLRRAFEEAVGQAAATLHDSLATPLAPPSASGTDW